MAKPRVRECVTSCVLYVSRQPKLIKVGGCSYMQGCMWMRMRRLTRPSLLLLLQKKKKTHQAVSTDPAKKGDPKSFVFRRGRHGVSGAAILAWRLWGAWHCEACWCSAALHLLRNCFHRLQMEIHETVEAPASCGLDRAPARTRRRMASRAPGLPTHASLTRNNFRRSWSWRTWRRTCER